MDRLLLDAGLTEVTRCGVRGPAERARRLLRDLRGVWDLEGATWRHLLLVKALEVMHDEYISPHGPEAWEACVMLREQLGID